MIEIDKETQDRIVMIEMLTSTAFGHREVINTFFRSLPVTGIDFEYKGTGLFKSASQRLDNLTHKSQHDGRK